VKVAKKDPVIAAEGAGERFVTKALGRELGL
jgi:hypothetical protein